jgi:catechol 2,3-dioxygenase-like lactoylglutathione lyase family enzyme
MTARPPVTHVLETSLYVDDLDRSEAFYVRIFGFERFLRDERMCALGVPGRQVLLLFRRGGSVAPSPAPDGGVIPPHDGDGQLHLCFAIPASALEEWARHLESAGIAIESRVRWPAGGTSLYFRDPDRNSLEVASPGLWPNYPAQAI